MPEVIHNFTSGKMNKDLDERLVPNGEYRDSLNLEISTSESSNVGSLQTVLGNAVNNNKTLNPQTGVITEWGNDFIPNMYYPCTIGSIRDDINEKIYWFLASSGISAIAEYDQKTDTIAPVLVDTQNILKFSKDYLITGISILEGILMWTDNQTEPKSITIETFKNGSTNFLTHTTYTNGVITRDFQEEDVTVIKKYPTTAPMLDLANTRATDPDGNPAVVNNTTAANFTEASPTGFDPGNVGFVPLPPGSLLTLNWLQSPYPFYSVNDVLILTTTAEDDDEVEVNFEARVQVVSVPQGATQTSAQVSVLSVSENVSNMVLTWDVTLEEDDPLFEFKFPRFAYRWKYEDNQFSAFSPFSEVAFLPGEFEYNTFQGYNLGMKNTLRQCLISNFITNDIPDNVKEVELLYKETSNTNVYKVDAFERDDEIWTANTYDIQSEIISSVLPSNQILRPYDNVPRYAKSLEISANRLIFGNYVQNYTLLNDLNQTIKPTIDILIAPNTTLNPEQAGYALPPTPGVSHPSIKSQRTYQVGVVYSDKYGRQSPVFTSESAATILQKPEANEYNRITATMTSLPPEGFDYFTWYIKEASQPYYNIAMDRWYEADDQNIWISFPSSERNKIDENTFLELKKQHDSDEFVSDPARYKVVAISNEAPIFIRERIKTFGTLDNDPDNTFCFQAGGGQSQGQFPLPEYAYMQMRLDKWNASPLKEAASMTSNPQVMRIVGNTGRSDWYDVAAISETVNGLDADVIQINIEGRFGDDMEFTSTDGTGATQTSGLQFELAAKVYENKPEYEGRFFVKLYRDLALEKYILANANDDQYSIKNATEVGYASGSYGKSYWKDRGDGNVFIDNVTAATGGNGTGWASTTQGAEVIYRMDVSFSGVPPDKDKDFNVGHTTLKRYADFVDGLEAIGQRFRWKQDPGIGTEADPEEQGIYEITSSEKVTRIRNYESDSRSGSFAQSSNKRTRYKIEYKLVTGTGGFNPTLGNNQWTNQSDCYTMELLAPFFIEKSFSSTNPGIWETEPAEAVDLDIYYKASDLISISNHGDINNPQPYDLSWYNCYSFGNGVESDRIRDDFNAPTLGNGPIASAPLDEPYAEERKTTGFIYSGLFNSISGINNLNQFIQAESITLDINPRFGSIQKLWARDTDLITFCEDKVLSVPANKDILFSAAGNTALTASNKVLGTPRPYAGEYGISKNPESFANYGFRAYFTDKARGAVLRLSSMPGGGGNGLTPISEYGMIDFFADNLAVSTLCIGGFDDNKKAYNLYLDPLTSEWQNKFKSKRVNSSGDWEDYIPQSTVLSFKEKVTGWETRKSFENIEGLISLNNVFYTWKDGMLWRHGMQSQPRLNFYGIQYDSSINFLINEMPEVVKSYKTLNYLGSKSKQYLYSNAQYQDKTAAEMIAISFIPTSQTVYKDGWYTEYLTTDLQTGGINEYVEKEGKWFQYLKGDDTFFNTNTDNNVDSHDFSVQGIGRGIVTGDLLSAYNVHIFINPSCYLGTVAPVANNMVYTVSEDCTTTCAVLQLDALDSNP